MIEFSGLEYGLVCSDLWLSRKESVTIMNGLMLLKCWYIIIAVNAGVLCGVGFYCLTFLPKQTLGTPWHVFNPTIAIMILGGK